MPGTTHPRISVASQHRSQRDLALQRQAQAVRQRRLHTVIGGMDLAAMPVSKAEAAGCPLMLAEEFLGGEMALHFKGKRPIVSPVDAWPAEQPSRADDAAHPSERASVPAVPPSYRASSWVGIF